ncbi:MAG: NAD(P)-binding protein [Alphaproteobacteria bacterium]|nr:NAD(P)-binding protein [Alphaproteobacteria bacterium]
MRRSIAIIGTGIAGLGAAYALHSRHDLTIFEKEERVGGHANTVDVDYDGVRIAVDTGFIVFNERNYPNLVALLEELAVETETSSMSFAVSIANGTLEWAGDNLRTLFAQKRNLLRPSFHAMWYDILKFNRCARADLSAGTVGPGTLRAYLDRHGLGESFRRNYLVPMGAAIWSMAPDDMLNFPALVFLRFFENHHLLVGFETPQWRTVKGGSREYVRRLTAPFAARIRCGTPARRIVRAADGVYVTGGDGHTERFDEIILACHSDEALALLADADSQERAILGAIRYAPNRAVLHRDAALMPWRRKIWSSWNYLCEGVVGRDTESSPVSVTYWMNRLQNIPATTPLFVSLNPRKEPDPQKTFATFTYDHPRFDTSAIAAQTRLPEIQGQRSTWFCGAWCGSGFHEDGLTAGLEIARALGAEPSWGVRGTPRIFIPDGRAAA